jgi:hypothetical protein
MNQTLFLAEKILQVLQDSNQSLESQLAAIEIVGKLLKAEPYGSLAWIDQGVGGGIQRSRQPVPPQVKHD